MSILNLPNYIMEGDIKIQICPCDSSQWEFKFSFHWKKTRVSTDATKGT